MDLGTCVRLRGLLALAVLLLMHAGIAMVVTIGTAWGRVPAGLVSALVAVPLAVAAQVAWTEWRRGRPGPLAAPARGGGVPVWARWTGWALTAVSLLGGAPFALFSWILALMFAMPPTCAPFSPPGGGDPAHEDYCARPTHAEAVASDVWWAVIAVALVLVVAAAIGGRRSRTAVFAAPVIVVSGCVIAADLAHLAAVTVGLT